MDHSSGHFQFQDCNMYHNCSTLYQCCYPSSEGYSSLSPASSTDSCGLSPPCLCSTCRTSQETYDNIPSNTSQKMNLKAQDEISAEKKNKRKGKLPYNQRQSASEREKMRMRNLSKALQNLRRYLPPSVVPADKTLTKIETLQLTTHYISHLSQMLGLSEEVLEQRRLEAIQEETSRCPQGFSGHMDIMQSFHSEGTEDNIYCPATTVPTAPARCMNAEPMLQTTQSFSGSYEIPYFSQPQTHHRQPQYSITRTALPHLSNEHCSTSLQQMVPYEEYMRPIDV
ncbi:mesoderm posterior protein 1-like [Hyperolius riggenbachi]|uniref:mesoderm posterior protein 1-like n=1 Tax=Hyperolius riggenbachi TaxID=752182 RepID=UPI0035A2F0C7